MDTVAYIDPDDNVVQCGLLAYTPFQVKLNPGQGTLIQMKQFQYFDNNCCCVFLSSYPLVCSRRPTPVTGIT